MTEELPKLPLFPTDAPAVFRDPQATAALFRPLFAALAEVIEVDEVSLDGPTPCRDFTVGELSQHVLGWLQFFAEALADPTGADGRPDPEAWSLGESEAASGVVTAAASAIDTAIAEGVAEVTIVMQQARMAGDGVLAMALGEYLVHGWDLSVATGRPWSPPAEAAEPALRFLETTVAPEHRGPESGFFDTEVAAPPDADAFTRLLCFAGRNPDWRP